MKALATFFGFVWRALDALRKVLHLIVLLVLFLGIGAALSPSLPIVRSLRAGGRSAKARPAPPS